MLLSTDHYDIIFLVVNMIIFKFHFESNKIILNFHVEGFYYCLLYFSMAKNISIYLNE
jgi:hypothetical protein